MKRKAANLNEDVDTADGIQQDRLGRDGQLPSASQDATQDTIVLDGPRRKRRQSLETAERDTLPQKISHKSAQLPRSDTSKRQSLRKKRRNSKAPKPDTDKEELDPEEDGDPSAENESDATDQAEPDAQKLRKGRPKARRRKERTPTPPRTLPPHEQYFFQTRAGGGKTSNNTFSAGSLLSHEEYFEAMKKYKDPHRHEVDFLHDLHGDSFGQWLFELEEGFNICLHGWGSKRKVLLNFAEYASEYDTAAPTIIVVNGFTAGITIRDILETLAGSIEELSAAKMPANPADAMQIILSALQAISDKRQLQQPKYLLLVHSLDAAPLRRPPTQSLLAQLVNHPLVSMVASCDTPNFPLLWDASLRTKFNWVFHDTTTFASFDAEVGGAPNTDGDAGAALQGGGVVDSVNALLGRSGRNVHGREGVVFVLRSLTESARRLYGLIVTEVLCADETMGDDLTPAAIDGDGGPGASTMSNDRSNQSRNTALDTSSMRVEYRALYRKAVQSLIATSEMQFRQLLKEFYDHEMLTSKKNSMGTELLSLPFRRDELESILEETELDG